MGAMDIFWIWQFFLLRQIWVLNKTIFLTQANMSFEYDNFSYSGKYEPRKSLGRLAFVTGGISWPVNSPFYLNDHKSSDLYLKMLTTLACLYLIFWVLCGWCSCCIWKLSFENCHNFPSSYIYMRSDNLAIIEKLDPVGSTARYEMMKLCTGSV